MSTFDPIGKGLPSAKDFAVATVTKKAAELGNLLNKTGMNKLFGSALSDSSKVDLDVSFALTTTLGDDVEESTPASQLPETVSANTNQFKVTITQSPTIGDLNTLVFDVMPKIDESRSVDYDSISPVHHPGVILKYRSTGVRTWNVSGRLVSRTSEEATNNLAVLNMIRSWTEPWYGVGTSLWAPELLGAPPPILTLSAYGSKAIGPVKCVLKSYSAPWDNTVDFIPTFSGEPFPVIMDITLSLEESYSPAEYSGFNLAKYKMGDLSDTGAFNSSLALASSVGDKNGSGRGLGQGGPTAEELATYQAARDAADAATLGATGDFARADRALTTQLTDKAQGAYKAAGITSNANFDPTAPFIGTRKL